MGILALKTQKRTLKSYRNQRSGLKKTVMNDTTHDLCTQTAFSVAHLPIKIAHPGQSVQF